MKTRTIAYWVTTSIVAFGFASGGLFDLSRGPQIVDTFAHLGYPAYLATLLGTWKVLGAGAILAPRLPRLKEWAYAGMVFDLTGAFFSHAATGDNAGKLAPPLVLLALTAASWFLRPQNRTLASSANSSQSSAPSSAPAESTLLAAGAR